MSQLKVELESAMHYDEMGDHDKAHAIVMHIEHPLAYRIHAYLHRKEGDFENAEYWYDKLDENMFDGSLVEERKAITNLLREFDES